MKSLDAAATLTRVSALMSVDVATISPQATLNAALARMVELNVGSLLITAHSGPGLRARDVEGLLPVFFALRARERGAGDQHVGVAAVKTRVTATVGESVADVLSRMTDNETWRLMVSDGEYVVGVISATDIMKLFAKTQREKTT